MSKTKIKELSLRFKYQFVDTRQDLVKWYFSDDNKTEGTNLPKLLTGWRKPYGESLCDILLGYKDIELVRVLNTTPKASLNSTSQTAVKPKKKFKSRARSKTKSKPVPQTTTKSIAVNKPKV